MTKKDKRILIVSAVLIVLGYLATLGMGLSQDNGSTGMDNATPSWTKVIGAVMSPFAPRVDLTNLRCFNEPVSSFFTLNAASSSCTIIFSKSSGLTGDEDFWKTEVQASSSSGTKVPVYSKSKFDTKEDAPSNCGTSTPQGLWLKIEYSASTSEESSGGYDCWLPQEDSSASFTVLAEGGRLTLSCVGCSSNRSINAKLE
ncbi:MAG: hypothetical protein ACI82Z_001898 [Cellvibrionaceae bacterium]|jgi:hypothetical protein